MRRLLVSGLVLLAVVAAVQTVGAAKKAKMGQKLDQADMEMMKNGPMKPRRVLAHAVARSAGQVDEERYREAG